MQNDKTWLAELKAGDQVVVGYGRSVGWVKRTTSTQIILDDTHRFRRSSGREVGRNRARWLEQATPDLVAEVNLASQRDGLISSIYFAINHENLNRLPTATLEAIAALLPEQA